MMSKTICIIPARGKSKRIPNKNIKKFLNKPLVSHVIDEAKKSNCFSNIFVTTDSSKIKKIAEKSGAKVPFIRSKKLSSDNASTQDVICDCITRLIKLDFKFENVCVLYPTSIFIDLKLIKKSLKRFKDKKVEFLFAVKKFDHPVERSFKINKNKPIIVEKKIFYKKTQDFSQSFYDAGQIYIGKKSGFLKKKNQFNSSVECMVLNYFDSIDIDNKDDFINAKKLFLLRKKHAL